VLEPHVAGDGGQRPGPGRIRDGRYGVEQVEQPTRRGRDLLADLADPRETSELRAGRRRYGKKRG
jgi:hypothetical protein